MVTSTTHKTLRGPRSGIIFFRRDLVELNLETRINNAVFPGCQVRVCECRVWVDVSGLNGWIRVI